MVESSPTRLNPIEFINAAIVREQMENPDCPMATLMQDLLDRYQRGDAEALDFALMMAEKSLAPRKSLFEKIRNKLFNRS